MGRPLKWQANPVMQQIVSRNRHQQEAQLHWLELQKAERYVWQQATKGTWYRKLGVVESLFDGDGAYWCGRADLHQNVRFEVKTSLSKNDLRERIVLAWTLMRHSHVLLSCKSVFEHEVTNRGSSTQWSDKCFVYSWPKDADTAIKETRPQVSFVADNYPDLDTQDFFRHIMNSSRALDAKAALNKLYVMPFQKTPQDTIQLHFISILAHQITDGLTTFRWVSHLARIMNMSEDEIRNSIAKLCQDNCSEKEMLSRLPPAQEVLYPIRSQHKARERWHWLLTRILRHVRTPPAAAFQNPLRRVQPLQKAQKFPSTYEKVLDYSETPPLNAGNVGGDLYGRSVQNMRRLCSEASISIGSGLFTLVAMAMMEMEERRHPDITLSQRLSFVGSFPVNPRPFLSGEPTTGKENSCMLAFSDGVTLPFLPRNLDLVGRFKVLGRLAHRQLRQYQKRKRSVEEEVHLGSRSPSQLIPALYCSTLERMEGRSEAVNKAGIHVQGAYTAKASPTMATCGISSVGDVSAILSPPKVDLNNLGKKDMISDFKGMASVVRPRDAEFLVGASGSKEHLGFLVAYDANAIDPEKASEWKSIMLSLLDRDLFCEMQAKL